MSEIIPSEKIENQQQKITKPVEATCIQKDTIKWLCELKTWVFETKEEKVNLQIEELLKTQSYLAEKVSAENEKQILLVLKSPGGKYHLITLPRSFGETQKLSVPIEGKDITLEATPKTNGYNTEYVINKGQGDWKQIAILFTLINPEWKKQKDILDTLESEKKFLTQKYTTLQDQERSTINHSKKIEREKKKNFKKILQADAEKIKKIKDELKGLFETLKKLEVKLKEEKGKLSSIKKLIDFPYTPYNKQYDTPEIRGHGFAYIHEGTKNAFSDLAKENSVVGGEKKLTIDAAFSHDIATTLNVVERMDFYTYFEKDGKTLKDKKTLDNIMNGQIHKALTTIALNQKGAFNWQRSKVGALGIGQFMPVTYENLIKNYSSVFPEKLNFENGAKNHSISFRLQGLHFHEESRAFPKWIKENYSKILDDHEARIGLYALIAAGYNGSIKRIVKEAELGDTFDKKVLNPENLIARLAKNKETQTYVIKFVYTWKYLEKNYREFGE